MQQMGEMFMVVWVFGVTFVCRKDRSAAGNMRY